MTISTEEKQKIFSFLTPSFSFLINEYSEGLDTENWDELCYKLPPLFDDLKYNTDCGASKGVIIPENKSYVIKIPFIRNEELDGNDFTGYWRDEEADPTWDYCEREETLFYKAKDLQLDDFFCEINCLGFLYGWPIYIQKKAIPFRKKKDKKNYTQEETNNFSSILSNTVKTSYYPLNIGWAFEAYCYYGKPKFIKLIDFLQKNDVLDDLHIGNIGYYINNAPCIFDFSGYYD